MPNALSNSLWIYELSGSERMGSSVAGGGRVAGGRGVEDGVEDEVLCGRGVEDEVLCGRGVEDGLGDEGEGCECVVSDGELCLAVFC